MRKILIAFCVFGFGTVLGQNLKPDVIASAGDFYKNSQTSLSMTVGECITETFTNFNNFLTQGFQQSNFIITEVEKLKTDFCIEVYPNPASRVIQLEVQSEKSKPLNYELIDLQGKVVISGEMKNNSKELDVSTLSDNIYFLKFFDNNEVIKNFKIVKIKN